MFGGGGILQNLWILVILTRDSSSSFSVTRRSWVASNSLLESYVHLVYENKNNNRKNIVGKYFSTDQKFEIFEISDFSKNRVFFENFRILILSKCSKIFKISKLKKNRIFQKKMKIRKFLKNRKF